MALSAIDWADEIERQEEEEAMANLSLAGPSQAASGNAPGGDAGGKSGKKLNVDWEAAILEEESDGSDREAKGSGNTGNSGSTGSTGSTGKEEKEGTKGTAGSANGAGKAAVIPQSVADRGFLREVVDSSITVERDERDGVDAVLNTEKEFSDLDMPDNLVMACYAMGYNQPSKIQALVIPVLMDLSKPRNVIAQARTGTGKTAAFVCGMLARVDTSINKPQAVCICPTIELAASIQVVIEEFAKGMDTNGEKPLVTLLAVKDESVKVDYKNVTAHVVVGTPGKVLEIHRKNRKAFEQVRILVLDEADKLIGESEKERGGHGGGRSGSKPTNNALSQQAMEVHKLVKQGKKNFTTALFSATFPPSVKAMAETIAPNPCFKVWVQAKQASADNITQLFVDLRQSGGNTPDTVKAAILAHIYEALTVGQSIVFVRTRKAADELTEQMTSKGHSVCKIRSGDMTVKERAKALFDFKQNKYNMLIATDLMARGIDIEGVMLVVNYDLPTGAAADEVDPTTYLHRIGRSGRFGNRGLAISFVASDSDRKMIETIEGVWHRKINEFTIEDLQNGGKALKKMIEEAHAENVKDKETATAGYLASHASAQERLAAMQTKK